MASKPFADSDAPTSTSEPGAGTTVPVQPSAPAPGAEPEGLVGPISFGAYFQSLGLPSHHAAGMVAFTATKYPRAKADWERLFAPYFGK